MGTANFGPLTNPSGPKAGRMRIREGKLPACGIQLKKNKQRKRRKTRRTKGGTVQQVFGGSPAVFVPMTIGYLERCTEPKTKNYKEETTICGTCSTEDVQCPRESGRRKTLLWPADSFVVACCIFNYPKRIKIV